LEARASLFCSAQLLDQAPEPLAHFGLGGEVFGGPVYRLEEGDYAGLADGLEAQRWASSSSSRIFALATEGSLSLALAIASSRLRIASTAALTAALSASLMASATFGLVSANFSMNSGEMLPA